MPPDASGHATRSLGSGIEQLVGLSKMKRNEAKAFRPEKRKMTTITLEEAQSQLAVVIANLKPGEEVLITREDRPVARLTAEPTHARKARQPGSAVGKLTIVTDDDAHLEDFNEYMS